MLFLVVLEVIFDLAEKKFLLMSYFWFPTLVQTYLGIWRAIMQCRYLKLGWGGIKVIDNLARGTFMSLLFCVYFPFLVLKTG